MDTFATAVGEPRARKWVKFTGSRVKECPQDTRPDTWESVLEDNDDGTYTKWSYSLWGPVGQTGTPAEGVTVASIKTAKDRKAVAEAEKSLERAFEAQLGMFAVMGGSSKVREDYDKAKAKAKRKAKKAS